MREKANFTLVQWCALSHFLRAESHMQYILGKKKASIKKP